MRRNVPQGIWTRDDGQETPQGMICSRDKTKSISVKPSVSFSEVLESVQNQEIEMFRGGGHQTLTHSPSRVCCCATRLNN